MSCSTFQILAFMYWLSELTESTLANDSSDTLLVWLFVGKVLSLYDSILYKHKSVPNVINLSSWFGDHKMSSFTRLMLLLVYMFQSCGQF